MPTLQHIISRSDAHIARIDGGHEIWQVIHALRDHAGQIAATAAALGLSRAEVAACVSYYSRHRTEIDAQIAAA